MATIWFLLYNIAAVVPQYMFYQVARLFNKKIARGISGRKGQKRRIRSILESIGADRVRILFHCVSVGEWEQALPLIQKLKNADKDVYIIVAFFSPSGFDYVKENSNIDLKVYLPFDSYFRAKKFLKIVAPDLWVIVKHDVWPNHLFAANKLNIPTVLMDATLPENSRRIKGIVRHFNKSVYSLLRFMFPISEGDRDRFLLLAPYPDRMIITGDTRFDQVYLRGQTALQIPVLPLFSRKDSSTFIAGSIWPSDEKYVLPAVDELLKKYDSLNIILAPHEPEENHLLAIEESLKASDISSIRYSKITGQGTNGVRVVIIDAVGLLVKLYSQSDIVYVGGSFGPGVHNVMEPGILGKPVLFGPRHTNSFEAGELINCGGGFSVNTVRELAGKIAGFLDERETREKAGNNALRLIKQNLGATDKLYRHLQEMYDFIP